MAILIKIIDTGTDYSICLFQSEKTLMYVVTTHDNVFRKHFDHWYYSNRELAEKEVKQRVSEYKI